MDLNKIMLIGNISNDPETKATPNGATFTKFSIATNRKWTDKQTGEMKEEAQFHNIVAWKGLSDVISKYAQKGKKIYIEGRLTHRSYEGKDGQKKYWTEVIAENVILLGEKGEQPAQTSSTPVSEPIPTIDIDADTKEKEEVIPF